MKFKLLKYGLILLLATSCNGEKQLEIRTDNKVVAIWYYQSDTLTGRKELFRWENGNKSEVFNYKNGQLDGEYLAIFENGHVGRRGNYVQGKRVGPYYRYFEDAPDKIQSESYYVFVNGDYYIFYTKSFNRKGELIKYEGNIKLELTERGDSARFSYVGQTKYDSMKLILGPLSNKFRPTSTVDTISFDFDFLQMPLYNVTSEDGEYVRAIFLAYKGKVQGDSIEMLRHVDYVEQVIDSLSKN